MERGLIHIYCGDGKGKTTAAVGLAVRAAGCGKRILFVRFLKNAQSGELAVLEQLADVDILHPSNFFGFYNTLQEQEKKECKEIYRQLWDMAIRKCREGYDLLVLDECMAACRYGMIDLAEAVRFLKEKPEGLEVVLTGRSPANELVEFADYVSDIQSIKHPFERGIPARRGIEF